MNCADFEIRLADYLDDTLGDAERVAFEEHVGVCAGCRELMEDASGGLRLTRWAEEVTPPAELLTRIAYQAPVGRLRQGWERQGALSRWLRPLIEPLLQPRFAMGMAMTILSFAMLERCTGVKVQHIQPADLNPVRIWGGLEDRTMRLKDRAVKYYENLRWVYEIEMRLGSLQREAAAESATQTPSRKQSDNSDEQTVGNGQQGQPLRTVPQPKKEDKR